ncbi:MAG: hypothetical protein FJ388_18085, partial [Verrucomicrobia bacterium]|nr:hypothetical protein [Verrucomicrobiota bacterium]
ALGVSAVMTQLALMREMLGVFWGNEMVLGIILGNWLLLTGLGAWLGRHAGRVGNPRRVLIVSQLLIALVPLAQVFLLRALRNVVFGRGVMVGVVETVVSSFLVLLPFCLVSGAMLTLACAILAPAEGAEGIGRVYVADSIGSIVGGVVFSFVLVRLFDHLGILYAPALLSLLVACALAAGFRARALLCVAALLTAALLGVMSLADADALSTRLQYPDQTIRFRANSPYGKLVVSEASGQFNFIENGLPVISTENAMQVEEPVHYAMIQRPDARRVLLIGGGVAGTAREILKYGVGEVTYVELDPLIIEAGRKYLPDSLADPRIRVVNTDGRLLVKQTTQRYDVVIVDVPDPSTSQINRFYTAEFFSEVKRILTANGVLSFGLGRYENYVSPDLGRMLSSACATAKRSFRNTLLIPGGRVFFLASDGDLHEDIAARIAQRRVPTRLVNQHYLNAMLTPDRMADLRRATAQAAAVNTDFSPVLYYYHLRFWISQFGLKFGLIEGALLLLLAVYLIRLRATPLAIFASGFAGSALTVVLLLGFQILYGSVYHQLGIIVTLFMTGLAVGAFVMSRLFPQAQARGLARLALAVALLSASLPVALTMLSRANATILVQGAIWLLTLTLGGLVGLQFPLASRIESGGATATASRLYTADFV